MPGRILIAATMSTGRIALKAILVRAHHDVIQASSADDVYAAVAHRSPALLLLDGGLPGTPAPELCRKLRADPQTATVPILVLAGREERQLRLDVLAAGADDVISKPVRPAALQARVRSLLRAAETRAELRMRESTARDLGFAEPAAGFERPGRVALVGATPAAGRIWKEALLRGGFRHDIVLLDPDSALEVAPRGAPDVFVLASEVIAPAAGTALLAELRSRPATRHAAILVVHPDDDGAEAEHALDYGANDLLEDGFDPVELGLRITAQLARKREADRLQLAFDTGLKLAALDPLTGLYNRRYAENHLAGVVDRARRMQQSFSVLMLDLDNFKRVNDRYGHGGGDAVLCETALRLRDDLRGPDLLARIGGEEFLIVLPDCGRAEAEPIADRIRARLSQSPVALPNGGAITVTASIGLAESDGTESSTSVIARADAALYRAKSGGRNRVQVAGPEVPGAPTSGPIYPTRGAGGA
ncbi:diguanylate cyclase [Mesobaculum littorinae]|uniref:diguanylate cyclase n=1 Tax=Mesobaculum littorinae TaxID=2486419 RepID=A0A438AJH8_9RHOB|nr:diguanylate cyclase [Mesobaculum littorinae]RVV98806.1 diguanylate cyclase [Mesobaculum littorinae]